MQEARNVIAICNRDTCLGVVCNTCQPSLPGKPYFFLYSLSFALVKGWFTWLTDPVEPALLLVAGVGATRVFLWPDATVCCIVAALASPCGFSLCPVLTW